MKKLIFMFLAILLCGIVQAQTSEIILNNGKVVKGKIKSLSFNVDNTHEVRIKNEVSGENFDYNWTEHGGLLLVHGRTPHAPHHTDRVVDGVGILPWKSIYDLHLRDCLFRLNLWPHQ